MNETTRRFDRVIRAGVAIAAIVACGAGNAAAQEAEAQGATSLERVVVEGGGTENAASATGPVDGYVATNTATGSKTSTPITQIPQSVSVIGREELEDRGVVNKIDEALRYTPGVTAAPFGTDPDTDWLYIRGFDATQTGVFLDGLTLYSYGFGGFQMDPFMLERIEVLKGPSSVLYGGANPGGIVNLVRKRPQDERLYYTETGINSDGNAFFGFDFNDKLNADGTLTYRLTGKIAGGDNYSDFSEDLRGFVMPQITYAPDDATSITVFGYAGGLDQVHTGNGFFPYVGTVVDAPFGKIRRDANYGEPDIDNGHYDQQMIGYEVSHTFDNGWTLSQNARYGHLYKSETGPYVYGYVGGTPTGPDYLLNRIGFDATSKVDTFAIDNRAETEFSTGGLDHTFLVGLDYSYYRLDHVQACCGATPISAVHPVYGVPQGANFVYLDQVLTQQQTGVYVQDQIRFGGGWLVTLNGRYDYVDTDSDAVVGTSYKTNDGALSGRVGLAYEFDNGVTPYVSASTFFRPVIGVSATSAFAPEEGYQVEGGVKYEPTMFDGLITASVFQITKQNVAVTIPGTFLQEQLGEVQSTGAELEAKVNINQNWKVLGSLSYTDLEVTEDADPTLVGKSPVLVPRFTSSLWIDYAVTDGGMEGLSLGAGMRHQGNSWANATNTLEVPSATIFDAGIRYEKKDWGASLNVTNLFDKKYVAGCQGELVCGYGDARTVTFKISKKW
ncbi:TonB-dependent siderophore receptor [Sinorhizobium sp. BG8]|uniref:TonB-dependent siderophore receptor n=1 Tax=Sinorhizobium sp. BG8 TaxID=2613773 RepID=UPI00193CA3ED|nr:TonB-dependent siderophore receptor [Sinorhizobium sp. BG8]QRM56540.1 TonB-dependent siderophore receptor [Sinorhizobium sp. BG8]